MFQIGDRARITKGFYAGHEVEIAEVVAEDVTTFEYSSLNGYSVYGLGATATTKISTFWDDELEPVS